jgi:hypothetical protein
MQKSPQMSSYAKVMSSQSSIGQKGKKGKKVTRVTTARVTHGT